jgi:transcriptional regulator with XRE-family HTH domain
MEVQVAVVSGPTVVRRQLGRRLKQARQDAGKSLDDVVTAGIMSKSTLQRHEGGQMAVNSGRVLELCRLYRLGPDATDALYALALGTQGKGWWEEFGQASGTGFGLYLGLESSAAVIQVFKPDLIHGLLQTADYARAVALADIPTPDAERAEKIVTIRIRRQEALFSRIPPAKIRMVLGVGALAQQVGGPDVMAAQVAHLHDLAASGAVDLRILPGDAGAHAGGAGAFTLMRYGNVNDPAVVYVEATVGGNYFELPAQVERYGLIFDSILSQSASLKEYAP